MTTISQRASCQVRRSRLTLAALAVTLASLTAPATAATFQYRHYVQGVTASPTKETNQAAADILVALTGGPSLSPGMVNVPYSFDLNGLLSVTGDPAYSASNVKWEINAGELPAGLTLNASGVLSGTPTTKNLSGSNFQVVATYKTKSGQHAYTIVVNGEVLQATQISSGGSHTCAVTTAGALKCWGNNEYGQLGNGTRVSSLVPVSVVELTSGVAFVSAGYAHTCAIDAAGIGKCWGYGEQGQLGPLSAFYNTTPVIVSNTQKFRALATGGNHTCGVAQDGAVFCWGYNARGQLGDNSTNMSATLRPVAGITAAAITAGGAHTCAITTAGAANCWGRADYGQLGYGGQPSFIPGPVQVAGLASGVTAISSGSLHTCAVVSGAAVCWGLNNQGQLGDGSSNVAAAPVSVSGLSSGVSRIATGDSHSCASLLDGRVKCWGYNGQGALGDGTNTGKNVPTLVAGVAGASHVTAGTGFTCAITTQGPKCWGNNANGQLGNNGTANSNVPVDVTP